MRAVHKLLQEIRNIYYEFSVHLSETLPRYSLDVPFIGQYARPEHAEKYANGTLEKAEDPHWQDSGAASPEHYAAWASALCGMAATAMCLKFFNEIEIPPITLAEDALMHGVYRISSGNVSAMHYREFAAWVRKYGLQAQTYTRLSLQGICFAISSGNLVMVSVSPHIRENTYRVGKKGGHLVLVTGYDKVNETLTIHNPSGFVSTGSHKGHVLSFQDFTKYYAGRGIVISATGNK